MKKNTKAARCSTLAITALLLGAGGAVAQPIRSVSGGVMVTVPKRIVATPGGSKPFDVETEEVGPLSAADYNEHLPISCAVATRMADGCLADGFFAVNFTHEPAADFTVLVPTVVWWHRDHYEVSWMLDRKTAESTGEDRDRTLLAADFAEREAERDTVPISYRQAYRQRAGFSLTYVTTGLPTGVTQGAWDRIIASVTNRYSVPLANSFGNVVIYVTFPTNQVTFTGVHTTEASLSDVAGAYFLQAYAQSEAEDENFADNFPPGASILTQWNSGTANISTIIVPHAIVGQIVVDATNQIDAEMRIDNRPVTHYDADASDGINAGTIDLEYTVTHETAHALGFGSVVDFFQDLTHDHIYLMDLWRFRANDIAGTGPSPTQFGFATRWCKNNSTEYPVIGCLIDTTGATFHTSRGLHSSDHFEVGHWNTQANEGSYIGVMDPLVNPGQQGAPGYLTQADWLALDAIGWNIDVDTSNLAPFKPTCLAPADGANVPLTPRVSWQAGANTSSVGVFLYSGNVIADDHRVYSQRDITESTIVIPTGVLTAGTTYGLIITGFNSNDFAVGDHRTFMATAGMCDDADFNGDGDIGTDADIQAFFACLAGTCCPACGDADFNNDGDTATDADIEAFFRVLAGGSC